MADDDFEPHQKFDTILTLDFGSQYTHLITRRLRELHVYSEMLPCTQQLSALTWKPKGIILSGGPYSVYDDGAPHVDPAIFELGVPILGICYGLQEIAWHHGKNVVAGTEREYGHAVVEAQRHEGHVDNLFRGLEDEIKRHEGHVDNLFRGLEDEIKVWMSHGDKLGALPPAFRTIATTTNAPFAGIAHESKPIYGLQFHPEVTHSPRGKQLLENFAVGICHAKPNWTMDSFITKEKARIRTLVGETGQVLGAVSGGVDSTVAAKLMHDAIGDRFHAVLVDNGCMRLNECEQVRQTLTKELGINLSVVDASDLFLDRLKGITDDPEAKRKVIGSLFIDVFEIEARRIEAAAAHSPNAGPIEWFLQGTLYPDVIESISFKGPSATIKTHHNVGGLPARMMQGQGLKLIEPLRELFKDEVRELGRQLGIHEDLVMRHPFPGPGIAIRVLGEVTRERVAIARKADHIFIQEIRKAGLYDHISQAYAALLPVKAVGVMGDKRVHQQVISLRAVQTTDFMTANIFHFDWDFLERVSTRICNEVDGVCRVVYDMTSKPPGTIEME
ncbi:GMP synthase [Podosphaera aphanis]|nr:GMP synthase [Podosphaera aphanis]